MTERAVKRAHDHVKRIEADLARARAALDAAVHGLHAAGLSYAKIAPLLGVTRARIQQMVEAHRDRTVTP